MPIAINAKPYSAELAKQLTPALGDYSIEILEEIKTGLSHIWEVGHCLFVVRFEQDRLGKEMVVIAATGEDLKPAAHRVAEQAYNIGCDTIRFHTKSPALHKLTGLPFVESERIYKMKVRGSHGTK